MHLISVEFCKAIVMRSPEKVLAGRLRTPCGRRSFSQGLPGGGDSSPDTHSIVAIGVAPPNERGRRCCDVAGMPLAFAPDEQHLVAPVGVRLGQRWRCVCQLKVDVS